MDSGCIVFVLASLNFGGAERHTATLINHYTRTHRVVVVYLRSSSQLLEIIQVDRLSGLVCLEAKGKLDIAAIRRLAGVYRSFKPSMVVCVNLYPLLYVQAARLISNTRLRVVEVFHTTLLRSNAERAQMHIYRVLLRFTDRLVFVCENQRRHWQTQALNHANSAVIHNGIEMERFKPCESDERRREIRTGYGFKDSDLVVGILAFMRPEKAHGLLVKAVADNKKRGVTWKILMIGDGPERASIEATVLEYGLDEQVVITGLLSDVRDAIAATDVLALVSTAVETFSIGALEAMSMGKPMIMSDIGGASEQVDHGSNGMLFPSGDVDALSAALLQCASHEVLQQMGLLARRKVAENFTEAQMLSRYDALLISLDA